MCVEGIGVEVVLKGVVLCVLKALVLKGVVLCVLKALVLKSC